MAKKFAFPFKPFYAHKLRRMGHCEQLRHQGVPGIKTLRETVNGENRKWKPIDYSM